MMNETIDADEPMPCMECRKLTTRLVIVWHGPLCSEDCDARFEDGYWEAERLANSRSKSDPHPEAEPDDVGF